MAKTAKRRKSAAKPKPTLPDIGKDELIKLYRSMYYMRRFELKVAEMYLDLHIGGFTHLYIGEEAIAAGAISILNKDDYVMSNYRDHGHYLMKGGDPNALMAELCGKQTGVCKGKGGSMHLFDLNIGFLGGYAIVGGGLPIALGVAYSNKYRDNDRVVMAFFGDGATNGGSFHAVLNMAKLWALTLVFVCKNNLWGIGTNISRVSAVTDLYKKAEGHGIPGEMVDGMDIFAVREAALKAVKQARDGKGPYFIEARTWRFRGHSMTDHDKYRSQEDKQAWRERDPIPMLKNQLLSEAVMTEAEMDKLEVQVQESINKAQDFALESPMPPKEALYEDVYA